MGKLKVSTREIGSVRVFDLEGNPTQETLQEVAWKIQRNIRRYRIQRMILNLQLIPSLEPLGLRKLLAACIRPQRSLIYGASVNITQLLENTYLPRNVRICTDEKDVAEDLGPFLMEKEDDKKIAFDPQDHKDGKEGIGSEVERRRAKRMHVALPIELELNLNGSGKKVFRAISTNISEGGMFAEFLDLESGESIEHQDKLEGSRVGIRIFPSANFPEEYHVEGKITRKTTARKQIGVGIQFLSPEDISKL